MLRLRPFVLLLITVVAACGPVPEPAALRETAAVIERSVVGVVVGAAPEPDPPGPPGQELEGLWLALHYNPRSLDPQSPDATEQIIEQCFEGLFEYRGDGSITPTGATGYEVSNNGRFYLIHLRQDAVWSDGVPVVAQHYVDGIIRTLHPDMGGDALLMYAIEGAEEFNTGETYVAAMVGVRAVDDHTLEIRLAKPTPYFDKILPFASFFPARLDIVDKYGNQWTEPGNYVSNGPYLLETWQPQQELVLVKNPTYHSADSVSIEKITFPIVSEEAGLAMYENNELHVTAYPSEEVERIWADPVLSQEVRPRSSPGVHYLGLNTLRPPTDDVRVRQALASAIDRKSLLNEVLRKPWRFPESCTTPPQIMGHQEWGTCGHTFDPEKARQLLAEAGYPDGEGFPVLVVWHNDGEYSAALVRAIASMWVDTLNIEVELRDNSWRVYIDRLNECLTSDEGVALCEFNVYRNGWVMDHGDPQNQLEVVFAPSSPYQYTGWQNERYDELLALASTEVEPAKRGEYYMEADTILSEQEAVIIPIHGYGTAELIKSGISYEFNPFGHNHIKHWALP